MEIHSTRSTVDDGSQLQFPARAAFALSTFDGSRLPAELVVAIHQAQMLARIFTYLEDKGNLLLGLDRTLIWARLDAVASESGATLGIKDQIVETLADHIAEVGRTQKDINNCLGLSPSFAGWIQLRANECCALANSLEQNCRSPTSLEFARHLRDLSTSCSPFNLSSHSRNRPPLNIRATAFGFQIEAREDAVNQDFNGQTWLKGFVGLSRHPTSILTSNADDVVGRHEQFHQFCMVLDLGEIHSVASRIFDPNQVGRLSAEELRVGLEKARRTALNRIRQEMSASCENLESTKSYGFAGSGAGDTWAEFTRWVDRALLDQSIPGMRATLNDRDRIQARVSECVVEASEFTAIGTSLLTDAKKRGPEALRVASFMLLTIPLDNWKQMAAVAPDSGESLYSLAIRAAFSRCEENALQGKNEVCDEGKVDFDFFRLTSLNPVTEVVRYCNILSSLTPDGVHDWAEPVHFLCRVVNGGSHLGREKMLAIQCALNHISEKLREPIKLMHATYSPRSCLPSVEVQIDDGNDCRSNFHNLQVVRGLQRVINGLIKGDSGAAFELMNLEERICIETGASRGGWISSSQVRSGVEFFCREKEIDILKYLDKRCMSVPQSIDMELRKDPKLLDLFIGALAQVPIEQVYCDGGSAHSTFWERALRQVGIGFVPELSSPLRSLLRCNAKDLSLTETQINQFSFALPAVDSGLQN